MATTAPSLGARREDGSLAVDVKRSIVIAKLSNEQRIRFDLIDYTMLIINAA
jgi:hypothetical protein